MQTSMYFTQAFTASYLTYLLKNSRYEYPPHKCIKEGTKLTSLSGKCPSENKKIVSLRKKNDSTNHKNKLLFLRSERIQEAHGRKSEKHLSFHQPKNSLVVKARACRRARVSFENIPHSFYPFIA